MKEDATSKTLLSLRVKLRPWQRGDTLAQELWPRYTEPFSSLWNIPRPIHYDDLIGRGWSTQRYVWAVEDRQRRMVGRISLREIEADGSGSRLGISLAQPYVGQGIGTEALTLFLNHYFGPLAFEHLSLDVAAFNRRAVRCYNRLDFVYMSSEWRSAGTDPSLRLLDDPRFSDMLPYFRRNRFETFVEFYEMLLTKAAWHARSS